MRPLNRPMFKNGGPLKEGIMDGMKDNRQAINTVGSPLAPKDETGRGGYGVPLLFTLPYLGAAARFAVRPIGKFVARQSKGGKMLGLKPVEKFQVNPFIKNDPLYSSIATGTSIFGKGVRKGAGLAKSAVKYGTTTPSGLLLTGATVGPYAYDKIKGGLEKDAPDKIETEGGPPGGGDPNMFAKPKESKIDADKIAKDRIEANRKRYYELMGLDKAKKDDVYRGLIDASNIIQEEGADLKGSIKSGTLQNRIINALSKQLDKSADLKKQIDAAILKGEITKDIEQSKVPDNIRTARMLGISDKEYKDKILGETSLKDNLIAAYNKQGSFPAGNQLAGFARNSGINITGVEDSQAVKDWMEANSSNEEGYIQSLVKEGKVPDGTYVINNRIFQVNGQDITSIV